MADEQLKIVIGADVGQAVKSLSQLTAHLKSFQEGLKTATNVESIGRLNRAIAETENRIKTLKNIGNTMPNVMGALSKSSNTAAFALQNVGRVAQDIPFGFIGIQNNLNPLLESFQRLKAETGSSGKALKALGSSLIGAGGIGFALSIVSSLVLLYQNGMMNFGKKTKEAKDKLEEFLKTIRSSSSIIDEATGSMQGQIVQVNALAAAVTNLALPEKERLNALEKLKSINKERFGDMTLEESKLKTLTRSVEDYTAAIINEAITKEFSEDIAKMSKELFNQEKALLPLKKTYQEVFDKAEEFAKIKPVGGIALGGPAFAGDFKELGKLGDTREAFLKQRDAVDAIRSSLAGLKADMVTAVQAGLKFDLTGKGGKGDKLIKAGAELEVKPVLIISNADREKMNALLNPGGTKIEAFSQITQGYRNIADALTIAAEQAKLLNDQELFDQAQLEGLIAFTDKIKEQWDMQIAKAQQLQNNLGTLGEAFKDFFEKTLERGQNFGKLLAQTLVGIIKKLLAAAAAALVLTLIIGATTGFSIPGGGGFMKILMGQFGKTSGLGGLGLQANNFGSGALMGAARGGGSGLKLETIIRGQDLLILSRRATTDLNRT